VLIWLLTPSMLIGVIGMRGKFILRTDCSFTRQ
jgi:hypothetical protein